MNKDLTLLIMAAGMGSRFGGLKQMEPFGPNGEFLIDYSIYDAIKNGFNKVVFIIKEENYEAFKETIGARVEKHIKVEYAFQKQDTIPEWVKVPANRIKPWGTAHAILSAKNLIHEPFAVINADDFYGEDAFKVVSNYLKQPKDINSYCIVGYHVENTLTENGSVKRGICNLENNNFKSLIESSIERKENTIIATPLDSNNSFIVEENTLVSMNMLGFNETIFEYIEKNMDKFFKDNENNLEKCEYLIPDVLTQASTENYAKVEVVGTNAKWMGVTYKEDKDDVVNKLNNLINNKEYPSNLWNN